MQLIDLLLGVREAQHEILVLATLRIRFLDCQSELVAQCLGVGAGAPLLDARGRVGRDDLDSTTRRRLGAGGRWLGCRGGSDGNGRSDGNDRSGRSDGSGGSDGSGNPRTRAVFLPLRVLASNLGERPLIVTADVSRIRDAQDHARLQRVDVSVDERVRIRLQDCQHHALYADRPIRSQSQCDRPERLGPPDRTVRGLAVRSNGLGRLRSRFRDGRPCIGWLRSLRPRLAHRRYTGGCPGGSAGRHGGKSQVVPPDDSPARPFDVDEKRQGRFDDWLVRRHPNVAASIVLNDDLEFEELEVAWPRKTGELELRRGAQHDLHPLEISGLNVAHGNPRIQRLVPRRSGFYHAHFQCGYGRRHEEHQTRHGYDQTPSEAAPQTDEACTASPHGASLPGAPYP